MRIGIDCRTILDEKAREKAGVAHYTYYLAKTLLETDKENEYVLFWPSTRQRGGQASSGIKEFYSLSERRRVEGLPKIEIQFFRFSKYKRFLPYIYSHILIANQIRQANLDVFHSPANIVPMNLLEAANRPKLVVTLHDLAIYRHPEWFPPRQGFSVKYLVPKTIRKVDQIIVPSMATKNDIRELFGISDSKISVIPHGVEERFFPAVIRNPEEAKHLDSSASPRNDNDIVTSYILFVGTLEPRKNLVRLIKAYASLPQDILAKYDLVIAGQKGWKYQEVIENVKSQNSNVKNKIKILGYYPAERLPELLKNASVFVYPSLYEGFGLPVLEAMAAGCPIITSNLASLPELVGDQPPQAGILVNPYSVQEITSSITKLIRDKAFASQISRIAQARAREFTWTKTARETLRVYEGMFGSK